MFAFILQIPLFKKKKTTVMIESDSKKDYR